MEKSIVSKPLIMIIEDNERVRQNHVENIKSHGCSVVQADDIKSAVRLFMISPRIDLIWTDIDLNSKDDGKDKSGVYIAKFIKQLNNNIPIVGYSSQFVENELLDEDIKFFEKWFPKGANNLDSLNDLYNYLKDRAILYKQQRYDIIFEKFNMLKEKQVIKDDFNDSLKLALEIGEFPIDQVEEALMNGDYKLIVLKSSSYSLLKKDILVWLKTNGGMVELEVYGYSSLYSYGKNEKTAMNNLITIIQGFAFDFKNKNVNIIASTNELEIFLASVVENKIIH